MLVIPGVDSSIMADNSGLQDVLLGALDDDEPISEEDEDEELGFETAFPKGPTEKDPIDGAAEVEDDDEVSSDEEDDIPVS